MPSRRPYPSDLSDARWELVEPVLAAWRFERRGRALDFGRPPEHDLRDIMDAILYVDRTGVQWRYLPHDFPHWNTVYGYFARWQQEGVFAQLNGLLRQLLRQKEGREAEPSACVIDAQSVKTFTSVLATGQGIDAGKEIVGRKRSIVTDTIGLLLAVLVTAASVQDSIAGTQLLDQVAAEHPGIRKVWVDGGYRQYLVEHASTLGIDMEITQRKPGTRGFKGCSHDPAPLPLARALGRRLPRRSDGRPDRRWLGYRAADRAPRRCRRIVGRPRWEDGGPSRPRRGRTRRR
ncbi:IS5 family transposase [Streptomyces sp. NPDC002740]